MRLLLDEMHTPLVAVELRDRGYDVIAVKERREVIGFTDDDLLTFAIADGRAIVTENIRDFAALHQRLSSAGHRHAGLVFTHPRRFPRGAQNHVRVLSDALGTFIDRQASALGGVPSFVWWLEKT